VLSPKRMNRSSLLKKAAPIGFVTNIRLATPLPRTEAADVAAIV